MMTVFHFWVNRANFVFCFPHRNIECVRVLPLDIQPLFWMRSEHPADSSSRLRRPVYYHFPVWLGCYSDIPPVTHPRAGDVWARQGGTHIIQVFLPLKKITCVLKSACGDHFKGICSIVIDTFAEKSLNHKCGNRNILFPHLMCIPGLSWKALFYTCFQLVCEGMRSPWWRTSPYTLWRGSCSTSSKIYKTLLSLRIWAGLMFPHSEWVITDVLNMLRYTVSQIMRNF